MVYISIMVDVDFDLIVIVALIFSAALRIEPLVSISVTVREQDC